MNRYFWGAGTVLCLVVFIFLILFLIGFKFVYAPELENSWDSISAISGMLSVIISTALTGIIIFQTGKINRESKSLEGRIANKEFDLRNLELKISLFDKRFAVFECAEKYINS